MGYVSIPINGSNHRFCRNLMHYTHARLSMSMINPPQKNAGEALAWLTRKTWRTEAGRYSARFQCDTIGGMRGEVETPSSFFSAPFASSSLPFPVASESSRACLRRRRGTRGSGGLDIACYFIAPRELTSEIPIPSRFGCYARLPFKVAHRRAIR